MAGTPRARGRERRNTLHEPKSSAHRETVHNAVFFVRPAERRLAGCRIGRPHGDQETWAGTIGLGGQTAFQDYASRAGRTDLNGLTYVPVRYSWHRSHAPPKPRWVRDELIRLKALMPHAGCRMIAHCFNRRFAERRRMTVGKTYVADTLRRQHYAILCVRRRLKHRVRFRAI